MTPSPSTPMTSRVRICARARLPLRLPVWLMAVLLLAAMVFPGAGAPAADRVKGELKVSTDEGYARLVFRFEHEMPAKVQVNFPILTVTFKQPVSVSVDRLSQTAPNYISAARLDPDGMTIRIALVHKIKLNTIPAAERFYVDLLPETWDKDPPGLPRDVVDELTKRAVEAERQLRLQRFAAKAEAFSSFRVKVATQPTFTRYVFTMPDLVNAVPDSSKGKLALDFDQPIKWDLADARAALPPTVSAINSEVDDDSAVITFVLKGSPKIRTFREDRSIVVDIDHAAAKPNVQEGEKPVAQEAEKPAAEGRAMAPSSTAPATTAPVPQEARQKAAAQATPPQPPKAELSAEQAAIPAQKVEHTPAEKPAAPAAVSVPVPQETRQEAAAQATPQPPKGELPAKQAATPVRKVEQTPAEKPAMPAPLKAAQAAAPAAPNADRAQAPAPAVPKSAAPAVAKPATVPTAQAPGGVKRANRNPDAPVVAELRQTGDRLEVGFPFATPTPAAVFQRGDTLWLVFDSKNKVDLSVLATEARHIIRSEKVERGSDGEAIVSIKLERPRLVSMEWDSPGWVLTFDNTVVTPSRALAITRSVADKARASITIPIGHPGHLHKIADRDIGGRLLVVTALGPARGFLKGQNFVELRVLPSTQGVVLQPLADDIAVALATDRITVTRPAGLSLSPMAAGPEVAKTVRAASFEPAIWRFNRNAPYHPREAELIQVAAMAPESQRKNARLNLVGFYLANHMGAEAKGVLDVMRRDARNDDDITGSVLSSVADLMLYRPDDALKDLSNPSVGNQLDAPIWRGIAYTDLGKWPEAQASFKNVDGAIAALPVELQRLALRKALHTAIEVRDFGGADRILNELTTIGVPTEMQPKLNVLIGQLREAMGRTRDALASYHAAASSSDRQAAAQGRMHEILLRYATGDMQAKEAIDALELLTTVWRGDAVEAQALTLLAHLYIQDHRYRAAFHVMRTALLVFPESDYTRKIQDEARASFEDLFLGGKADSLPPVEAIALFYDFRDLTPIGWRGDEMIRRLADRLVAVDLLDQAAELLEHQVDNRLQGVARAQVATRLAVIYLMNHKPERALATLQKTRTADVSNELRDQRLLLEARALSDTGRHELALELITNLDSHEAIRLRSDILWTSKRWRDAAEQIELLYGDRWKKFTPLSEAERFDILRAAVGYSLGDDSLGLARFRERYMPKMTGTPDARAFDVVSAPTGNANAEFQDIAKKVTSIDSLEAFLRDMRNRYPDASALSRPPAQGAEGAPPAPAAPTTKPAADAASAKPAAGAAPAKAPAQESKIDRTPTGSIGAL